jgi:hypothetical protein
MTAAWFKNKTYYGVDAQKRMQLGFAVSSFLVLVAVPTWFEYCMGYNKKRQERKPLLPNYQSPESNAFRAEIKRRLVEAKYTKLSPDITIESIEKL